MIILPNIHTHISVFNYEKHILFRIKASNVYFITRLYSQPVPSVAALAEILPRSPRKLFIFIIKNYI